MKKLVIEKIVRLLTRLLAYFGQEVYVLIQDREIGGVEYRILVGVYYDPDGARKEVQRRTEGTAEVEEEHLPREKAWIFRVTDLTGKAVKTGYTLTREEVRSAGF